MRWYGRDHVDEKETEREEVIKIPLPRGWGLVCQADVIAKAVDDKRHHHKDGKEKGLVIGGDETLRVLS